MSVFVLWEDSTISPIARFGPHVFLTACVASRKGVSRYELTRSQAIDGKPCAGNANVLRELKREPLWNAVSHVVAVLDSDEIHDRLPGIRSRRMVADAEYERWSESVTAEVRERAPVHGHARLEICLLDRNLESLLSVIGHGVTEIDGALAKSRLHRDKILQRAAGDDAVLARACAEMPSWERLVATVTRILP
jgi:hypothetical protein